MYMNMLTVLFFLFRPSLARFDISYMNAVTVESGPVAVVVQVAARVLIYLC